jgi:cytochrome c2
LFLAALARLRRALRETIFLLYLCYVSKQVIYIIQAHLLLAALAGTYLFLKSIPAGSSADPYPDPPGITDTHTNTPGIPANYDRGQTSFFSKCASCHAIDKRLTGPALKDFEERGPWGDREKLYEWIKNPSAFLQKDKYARDLQKEYKTEMTAFSNMTNEEIDAIVDFINYRSKRTAGPLP